MKYSPINILDDVEIYTGSMSYAIAGKESNNILDNDTLRVYASLGNIDVSIFNIGGASMDFVSLVNVFFDETLTIQLYDVGNSLLYEETFGVNDWTGLDNKYIYMLVPSNIEYIDRIRVFTTGDDYTENWIGYIWAGMLIDIGCFEFQGIKPVSVSNDSVQISRTNHPHINESYLYRELDFTSKVTNDWKTVRAYGEIILSDGYGKGRPWIIEEEPFDGEMMFAILDAPKIQNDYIYVNVSTRNNNGGQFTLGLREVT